MSNSNGFWSNMVYLIDSIPVPAKSDKPKTPSNKKKLEKFAKEAGEDIDKIGKKITDAATKMNTKMCDKLKEHLPLTVPPTEIISTIAYITWVVNWFRKQYNAIVEEEVLLIANVQKVVTALNNKVAEINDYCCSNEEFQFPQINELEVELGCSVTLPELELPDLEPVESPTSLTLEPLTCPVPPEE